MAEFPWKDRENYGDVLTIAARAGIELRDTNLIPHHCDQEMQVKAGLYGADYVHCHKCGLNMHNAASPHVNAGIIFNNDIMDEFGMVMWTWTPPPTQEDDDAGS